MMSEKFPMIGFGYYANLTKTDEERGLEFLNLIQSSLQKYFNTHYSNNAEDTEA